MTLLVGQNDEAYDEYWKDSNGWDHEVYFGTVSRSMMTLFQVVTLESWCTEVARRVTRKQPFMVFFFLFYLAGTTFGLLNLVIAVVVENTLAMANEQEHKHEKQEEKDRVRVLNYLREVFEMADEDGSGTLTLDEVKQTIDDPDLKKKLRLINFP